MAGVRTAAWCRPSAASCPRSIASRSSCRGRAPARRRSRSPRVRPGRRRRSAGRRSRGRSRSATGCAGRTPRSRRPGGRERVVGGRVAARARSMRRILPSSGQVLGVVPGSPRRRRRRSRRRACRRGRTRACRRCGWRPPCGDAEAPSARRRLGDVRVAPSAEDRGSRSSPAACAVLKTYRSPRSRSRAGTPSRAARARRPSSWPREVERTAPAAAAVLDAAAPGRRARPRTAAPVARRRGEPDGRRTLPTGSSCGGRLREAGRDEEEQGSRGSTARISGRRRSVLGLERRPRRATGRARRPSSRRRSRRAGTRCAAIAERAPRRQ